MPAYSENRRATAVPSLKPVTRNEATEGSDVKREQAFERAREANADALKKENSGSKRAFGDLIKKTPARK